MESWNRTDGTQQPTLEIISGYVNNPLWESLNRHMRDVYQLVPKTEFSKCSMQMGWNVKYKKSGRTLCTLYPMEGFFIALIVIAERERMQTELSLPLFSESFQDLYHNTKSSMGQKWLIVNVVDDTALNDVLDCISIRAGLKKQ